MYIRRRPKYKYRETVRNFLASWYDRFRRKAFKRGKGYNQWYFSKKTVVE
jgi:hypothetical protein